MQFLIYNPRYSNALGISPRCFPSFQPHPGMGSPQLSDRSPYSKRNTWYLAHNLGPGGAGRKSWSRTCFFSPLQWWNVGKWWKLLKNICAKLENHIVIYLDYLGFEFVFAATGSGKDPIWWWRKFCALGPDPTTTQGLDSTKPEFVLDSFWTLEVSITHKIPKMHGL